MRVEMLLLHHSALIVFMYRVWDWLHLHSLNRFEIGL